MVMATLSAKVEADDKRQFERFCEETGMNVSVCINMFVKTVLRNRRLPFEITVDPFYSPSHIALLESRLSDANAGKNMHEHELREADE